MATGETELQTVQRHIREGEGHVQRQREIIIEMGERGAQTDAASTCSSSFKTHFACIGNPFSV